MKPKNILLISGILILFFATNLFAQQDNTLYFMNKIPQANLANPANGCDCKVNVWGLLIPVFGQLPPPISFNIGNTGFSLKKLFTHGKLNRWDDTVLVDTRDSLIPDFNYLFGAMRKVNYITSDIQIHLLGAGYKMNDWYFNLGITEKINISMGYPKDLLGLIWKGNGAYISAPADLSGLGLNITHYREYMAGASRKINDKLTVGAHLKGLFGKFNLNTRKSVMKLYTDPASFDLRLQTDMEYNMNLPDSILLDFNNGNGVIDSLSADATTGKLDAKKYILNKKNFGMGIDLGGVYKLNKKIELSASIIDLGFITWKSNPYTFSQKGDFTYSGVNFPPFMNNNYKSDSVTNAFVDSVYKTFLINFNKKAYNTSLNTKFYIGGTYALNEKVNFGLLTRTELYQHALHLSVSLSANTNFTKWFSGSLTYSMINRYYMNIGVGLAVKAAFMQFYIVSDNIYGIRPEKSTGAYLPYSSRDINFRFGCNLIFGCPKNITKSFI